MSNDDSAKYNRATKGGRRQVALTTFGLPGKPQHYLSAVELYAC